MNLFAIIAARHRAAAAGAYLLDTYTGAGAAYSLRVLSSAWASSDVVLVRRSSDDAESGFTATEVSNGTMLTWVGTGGTDNGFVTTWYDQSGNANNAVQATTTSQPKVVSAGALVVGGLDFDNSNDFFNITVTLAQPFSIFTAYKALSNTSPVTGKLAGSGAGGVITRLSSGAYTMFAGTVLSAGTHPSTEVLASCIFNGATSTGHWNSVSILSGNPGTTAAIDTIGRQGSDYMNGTVNELIIYNTNESSNRVGIETNINAAYSIY